MPEHVTEWLNAYRDGELNSYQQSLVKAHLSACRTCQAELDSLEKLSGALREIPTPEFISPNRFVAQVNLRLPRRQVAARRNKILEIGWWMVPVGLLGAWIFISSTFLINDMLSLVYGWGVLENVSGWLVFGSSGQDTWSATLGQLGILSGNSLNWAAATEAIARASLLEITLQVSIALLYLSWMAIWWARRHRPEHGQLLEG